MSQNTRYPKNHKAKFDPQNSRKNRKNTIIVGELSYFSQPNTVNYSKQ